MHNLLKASVSIAALSVFLTSNAYGADIARRDSIKDGTDVPYPAPAGTAINWTGVYIGGQVGYGNANHNLRQSDTIDNGECAVTAPTGPVALDEVKLNNATDCAAANGIWTPNVETLYSSFTDGINSHGFFGGGTVGADIQRGHFVFGVFGDYNVSGLKTKDGAFYGEDDSDNYSRTVIEEGDSWLVAARAGYLFGSEKRALLYGLVGYGQTDVGYDFGGDDGKKDVTFSGFVVGAGGEYAISQNLFIGLEWQHFFGGKETLFSDDSLDWCNYALNSKLTDELDTDKVMVKLKLKLNGGLPNFTE